MMRNLRFRSNASIALYNNRPRRVRWLIPTLLLATGSLYGALQLSWDDQHLQVTPPPLATVTQPLYLPDESGVLDATATPQPLAPAVSAASHDPSQDSDHPALRSTAPKQTTIEKGDRWLVHEVQPGDCLSRIFKSLGLSASLLHRIVQSGEPAKQLASIKPGQTLRIHLDAQERFTELLYQIDPAKKLRVAPDGKELATVLVERDVDIRSSEASGVIESSLFESAQEAGLSDALTLELAKIFGWDIDFALEIQPGDRFSLVFSEEWLDGEKLEDGPILAAEFVNQGKVYRAVRFVDAAGEAGYYTPDGKRMKKEFLRTPLKFSRISSGFTKRRWHPVLKKWRSHKGVDYAAPTGTPVKAAGDARVTFVGRKGGYGKVIFLQHQRKYSTVYGHLSRFAKGIKTGKRVKQGQLIGYVGQTGLATGPHLHYEFRVNGVHRDPLKVTKLPAAPIDKKYLPAFKKATQPLLARLDSVSRTMFADASQ